MKTIKRRSKIALSVLLSFCFLFNVSGYAMNYAADMSGMDLLGISDNIVLINAETYLDEYHMTTTSRPYT